MDYQKIYSSLINRAKTRNINTYTEQHHIVPKCLGGNNLPENLVNLTPEEHYVAHQLLAKIYKDNHKLLYAAVMMCSNRPTNKLYGWIKRKLSESQSKLMSGAGNNMFGKKWIANEFETVLTESAEADVLVGSGKYIMGKVATRAFCGCLVRKRCVEHENKRKYTTERKTNEFVEKTKALFDEFLQSDVTSITQFAKMKNTSQPAITQVWKKYIPEYSMYAQHGKSFKKNLT